MSLEINWQDILVRAGAHIVEESFKLMQEQAAFGFTVSVVTPGYEEPNTVEGSIVEPVTDPARLLPKGTELTSGRELAFDLPIVIERDRG